MNKSSFQDERQDSGRKDFSDKKRCANKRGTDGLKGDADGMGESKAEKQKKEEQGAAGQENGRQQWPPVESGWSIYGRQMDAPVWGNTEKGLYTDNDKKERRRPGAVVRELKDTIVPGVYAVNYLWSYFGLEAEFDSDVKEELLETIQAGKKLDKDGDSAPEQLFSKLVEKLYQMFRSCGALRRKEKGDTAAWVSWTESQVRKLLKNPSEEDFIQTFAPALGLSVEEIQDFLLKAYHRPGLSPCVKEEFLLYLAVLQMDSNQMEQNYYFMYRKLCEAYEKCEEDASILQADPRLFWKETEQAAEKLKAEKLDWTECDEIPAVLEELFRKHKAVKVWGEAWSLTRKNEAEKLWNEVSQLYWSELYQAKEGENTKEKQDGIWKNTNLEVTVCQETQADQWKHDVELRLPKNIGDTTLIPARLDQLRGWKETEKEVKEDGAVKKISCLNVNCRYGTWIPKGTILSVQKNGIRTNFEVTKEYLAIEKEGLRRFLYESTELLDDEEDPKVKWDYEADIQIFEGWLENTKLTRTAFAGFTERKMMAQRNYILTLLFLKFAKSEDIEDMEKEIRRSYFLEMADKALRKLQLPEIYLGLPYDVLLYYLLANREPTTEFRVLWARFEQCKKERKKQEEKAKDRKSER